MAILTVTQTTDFRGGAAETNIDQIVFQTPGPGLARATFEPGQFGPGLISNSVEITGDGFANEVRVQFGTIGGSFSAEGWTFQNWGSDDSVFIIGSNGNDTITGASKRDTIQSEGGLDHIDSGAGNDFIATDKVFLAGSTIEGGTQDAGRADTLALLLSGTVDLRSVAITGVELLDIPVNGLTAIIDGDQIGAGGFTTVQTDPTATVSLTVRGQTVDLSGVTFRFWGFDDTVVIEGTSNISNTLIGSNQRDTISGSGNSIDFMTGGDGLDTLNGGGGADFFRYVSSGDVDFGEQINGGAGADTIQLENAGANDFRFATITDVETLDYVSGNSTATFEGNSFDSGEIATVSGSAGIDQLIVTTDDQLTDIGGLAFNTWTNGTDSVTILGSGLGDLLGGSTQNDTIKGGGGTDLMDARAGVDTADYTDKTAAVVVALNGASSVTVTVGGGSEDSIRNFENVNGGSAGDTLTGDGLANTLQGGSGDDLLKGGNGADTLNGGNDVDTADYRDKTAAVSVTLNGGSFATVKVGGVAEDTIKNIENIFGGTGADTLSGDSSANQLFGGDNDDILKGGAGADTLSGQNGVDTADYRDKSAAVVVTLNGASTVTVTVGGVAEDTISKIENVFGGTGADTLTGDGFANGLFGGDAADILNGGNGGDILSGQAGADTFLFNTALNAATNLDHIKDFASEDTIDLENAIFTSLTTTGTLSASAFFSAAGATSAHDADDRIVYNTTTGALFYDADGIGGTAAVQFAVLDNHAAVTNADFVVV